MLSLDGAGGGGETCAFVCDGAIGALSPRLSEAGVASAGAVPRKSALPIFNDSSNPRSGLIFSPSAEPMIFCGDKVSHVAHYRRIPAKIHPLAAQISINRNAERLKIDTVVKQADAAVMLPIRAEQVCRGGARHGQSVRRIS